ncbi:D-2-hydroxyacid dehydrogenase [Aquibacillus rhizosphaerae]|uniref:D-2-hydroxyacid dehydrogenase n=1 Tax=Aquibacillus rhizosphaerae TaxID=3051431 RepID=A0ABT7LBG2_9BACI|nr:D-2-hydroxyacid dehydrogenase [Aquibacillus sp. LR5S19]MDL4841881.1 D-2-hydroxyacid dehydrogenase [Aquibacillus sp. LR5S19]
MLVISTTKLTKDIRNNLINSYPSLDFRFYENIEKASDQLSNAEVMLTYGEDLTKEIIEKSTNLKWIMVLSAGMDEMPLNKIKERSIIVTNSRGIHKTPMAEYAISMLLQVYRNSATFIENHQRKIFDRTVPTDEISGKTMLIVGAGAIGQELARIAKAFRIKTIGVSNSGKSKDYIDEMYRAKHIEKAIPEADFIVSILPSTKETADFYTYDHFKLMKSTAVFLNMGRGDVVSSDILIEAVKHNEIAHVVLDVFEQEPLPPEHPLWEMEQITMTPHISGKSPNYIPRAIDIFEENLVKYLNGKSDFINFIHLERGY